MSPIVDISASFPGTSRFSRKLPALDPTTFGVDERGMADCLAFAVNFGKALSYFNPQNKREGNWREILLSDPVLLTAYISKTDAGWEFAKYLDYHDGIKASVHLHPQLLFTQQFFSIGFHILLRINRWYRLSGQPYQDTPFREQLRRQIERDGRSLLRSYYRLYFSLCEFVPHFKNEVLIKLEDLDRIWLFEPFPCIDPPTPLPKSDEACSECVNRIVDQALAVGQELFHFQENIVALADQAFSGNLQRQDIAPHIGLLLTFLDLMQYQQDDINRLTQSHLDFYYRSILGFRPLPAQPDTVFVSLELAKGQPSYELPSDTTFSAGNDPTGHPVTFVNRDPLLLTAAKIGQYLTFNIDRDESQGIINGFYTGSLKTFDQLHAPSWPLLGSVKAQVPDQAVTEIQSYGFALSSPDLLLNSGSRKITITLFGDTPTVNFCDSDWEATNSACTPDLEDLFSLELTSTKGWLTYEQAAVQVLKDQKQIRLILAFSADDPAIVAYDPKKHGPGYHTRWPVCKATVKTPIGAETFNFLQSFSFRETGISCRVEGAEKLLMQNDRGKIAPGVTFPPFGNTPLPGANLYIGQQELFVKTLKKMDLNILWDHLPANFAVYYQGYTGTFNNQVFQAGLDYFNPNGNWESLKSKGQQQFPLFTDDVQLKPGKIEQAIANFLELQQAISNPRKISFDVDGLLSPQPDLAAFKAYTQELNSAFFRLQFLAPEKGFGSSEYANLIAQVTTGNGQAIISNAQQCKTESACVSLSFCKDLDLSQSKLKLLAGSYKTALTNLYYLCFSLRECGREVCSMLAGSSDPALCSKVIREKLQVYGEKLRDTIELNQEAIFEALLKAASVFKAFVQANAKILEKPENDSENTAELTRKAAAYLSDDIEDEENIVTQLTDALRKELAAVGTEDTPSGGSWLRIWGRKKEKPKAIAAGSGKLDLQSLIEEVIKLIYDQLGQDVLQQFDQCKPEAGGTTVRVKDCNGFESCMDQVLKKLDKVLEANYLLRFLFDALELMLSHWKSVHCPGYLTTLKPLPQRPFVPKIKSLSVDYQSCQTYTANNSGIRFFHLQPFGSEEITPTEGSITLLPAYGAAPYAFWGIQDSQAGDVLTLLVAVTSRLRSVDLSGKSHFRFEYLTASGWQVLTLQADSTFGFEQTGIIRFRVPADLTLQSSQMPAGYFWVRISQSSPIRETNGETVEIRINFLHTQALVLQRSSQGAGSIASISAGTIKAPAQPVPAIKKMLQPEASFGGKDPERTPAFYERVAYRLRHKNRSILPADLEHLVLENFPELYLVRAVPMTYFPEENSREVRIVLVPWTSCDEEYAFRPVAPPALRRAVLAFLRTVSPQNWIPKVINPDLVELKVTAKVIYTTQQEDELLNTQLNQELITWLSPWLKNYPFIGERQLRWNISQIQAFIQARSYVKKVEAVTFQLRQCIRRDNKPVWKTLESIQDIRPWQLVVSSTDHCINQILTSPNQTIGPEAPVGVQECKES